MIFGYSLKDIKSLRPEERIQDKIMMMKLIAQNHLMNPILKSLKTTTQGKYSGKIFRFSLVLVIKPINENIFTLFYRYKINCSVVTKDLEKFVSKEQKNKKKHAR